MRSINWGDGARTTFGKEGADVTACVEDALPTSGESRRQKAEVWDTTGAGVDTVAGMGGTFFFHEGEN
jgi:hypothetical protein